MSLRPLVLSHPLRQTLPPSIPLIIHGNSEWDADSNKLLEVQLEDDREEETMKGAPLKVVNEALEILNSINKPIAVLSICGPFRTGKSYLLSHILGIPGAFEVGHSMNACTKGVWMATTVLECEDYAVILLDTEGMDSFDAEANFVNSLLIVTTLLSSLLIYNSQAVPEWRDLEELRYIYCI